MRAQPGAKKTAIVGVYGEGAAAQLKIAVQAPPIEGRANCGADCVSGGDFSHCREAASSSSAASVAEQGVSAARCLFGAGEGFSKLRS